MNAGDLMFATNYAARKVHVVRVKASRYDDDVAGLSKHLSKEVRARRIAEIDPEHKNQWTATALCGVAGEHAFYGNYSRFYWRPTKNPSMEEVCKGCMKEWKKLDEPEIAGWDRSVNPNEEWPWDLPFGWVAVSIEGHPWDCADKADIESIKDGTGAIVGEHRVELRRWVRGPHIVRLVHHLDTDTFSARRWIKSKGPSDDDDAVRGSYLYARTHCHKMMAQGGY